MKISEKVAKEKYIKISWDWIGRNDNGVHLLSSLNTVDALYITSLIMFRYMYGNESRFILDELVDWYGTRRDRIIDKISVLQLMAKKELFELEMPYKDYYRVFNLDPLFNPKYNEETQNRYVIIYESEMNKILNCNKPRSNRAYLFALYVALKSHIYTDSEIGCPQIKTLVENTTIHNKSIANNLKTLMEIELIYYCSRGWDKHAVKNIGHVYTFWSENAENKLSKYIINNITKKDTS